MTTESRVCPEAPRPARRLLGSGAQQVGEGLGVGYRDGHARVAEHAERLDARARERGTASKAGRPGAGSSRTDAIIGEAQVGGPGRSS